MPKVNAPWYHEPTMLIVAGVLTFTFLSGTAMMTLSLRDRDVLTMTDSDYQAWRDEMRATATPSGGPANGHD